MRVFPIISSICHCSVFPIGYLLYVMFHVLCAFCASALTFAISPSFRSKNRNRLFVRRLQHSPFGVWSSLRCGGHLSASCSSPPSVIPVEEPESPLSTLMRSRIKCGMTGKNLQCLFPPCAICYMPYAMRYFSFL